MERPNARPSRGIKAKYTFASLHSNIKTIVLDEIDHVWFCGAKNNERSQHEYQTHVMGKFTCVNESCTITGWGSKKVAILIRGFSENGYNAEVYGQRCRSCKNLGLLELDEESYVDRVAYRIKKWAGVQVERPVFSRTEGPPHESRLCEGCRRGVCQWGIDRADHP